MKLLYCKFNIQNYTKFVNGNSISYIYDTNGNKQKMIVGTDFLSRGLKSPNGTPQNKFEEYKSISISGDIYNGFLNSQLSKYTSGKVKYSGSSYNLPADVFTDKANWDKGGNFFYNTGEKQPYGLKATGTAGRSIFWKTEK
jgi:hypothetical protein